MWQLTFVIEGYDQEFQYMAPGKLSRSGAVGIGRMACASEHDEKKVHIHLVSAEKLT